MGQSVAVLYMGAVPAWVVTVAPAFVVIVAIEGLGMTALAGPLPVAAATWAITARVDETRPRVWELRVA